MGIGTALVAISTKEPVVGVIADPAKRRIYLGVKGNGAYIVDYNERSKVTKFSPMPPEPEAPEFTYNSSPHFEQPLVEQVHRFWALGEVQPDDPLADKLEKARKKVIFKEDSEEIIFIDLESGALETVRNRGTIYFKTSNEMAAVFVILNELGGTITDASGKPWTFGINTLIAARNEHDYNYLLSGYNKTR